MNDFTELPAFWWRSRQSQLRRSPRREAVIRWIVTALIVVVTGFAIGAAAAFIHYFL
jgi:hypothetical protein